VFVVGETHLGVFSVVGHTDTDNSQHVALCAFLQLVCILGQERVVNAVANGLSWVTISQVPSRQITSWGSEAVTLSNFAGNGLATRETELFANGTSKLFGGGGLLLGLLVADGTPSVVDLEVDVTGLLTGSKSKGSCFLVENTFTH